MQFEPCHGPKSPSAPSGIGLIIEDNSFEATNTYSSSSDKTKFRLNEINKVKEHFNSEIPERKIVTKYIVAFDYVDKTLILLSSTSRGISIISFVSAIGAPADIASASFSVAFSLTARIIKKLLKIINIKRRNKIKLLCLLEVN